jgi:UDP-N-acetylmuramyl pentapeptide phosphotransferase/UDP-N-acetylglucosamine-1-phosphate transferase
LDHPNERSLHDVPIPRTGGLAIIGSFYLGLIGSTVLGPLALRVDVPFSGWFHVGNWILGMTILLGLVSYVDDRGGVPVWFRLGCQFAASGILALVAGLVLPVIEVPLLGTIELGWLGVPLTLLFLVWFTNLYNFMDGMDGFAGGMTVLGCGFLAYFAWKAGHEFLLSSALLLSVASAGFLVYNFPPAKIFMGDVGSVSSGFLCGALIIVGCRDRVFDFWVPFILFSPFILDATATLVGRVWQREKIWVAHRTHYYQRLVLSGWGHRKVVLAEYAIMALCGGFALFYQYASEEWRLVVLGAWGMLFLALAFAVKGVEQRIQPVGS